VVEVVPLDGKSEDEVLRLAAIAEKYSEHPLARSVMALARERNIVVPDPDEFRIEIGMGITAKSGNRQILVGKEDFLRDKGVSITQDTRRPISDLAERGRTVILVANDMKAVGLIAIADEIRPETSLAISSLRHSMGVQKIVMLTGDNDKVAKAVAEEIGVDDYRAGLLPGQKQEFVKRLQNEGRIVGMIGDGINDAPALAQADIGIAMGKAGTDVAIETADVTLMNDDLSRVVDFMWMSRKVLRRIKLNIFFSIIYNAVGLILGSLAMLTPVLAVIFQEAGCITVVFSSTLLLWQKRG